MYSQSDGLTGVDGKEEAGFCLSLCVLTAVRWAASSPVGYGVLRAQVNGAGQPWTEASDIMTSFLFHVVFLRYFNHSDEGNRNEANI